MLVGASKTVKVTAQPERKYITWLGGSKLASMPGCERASGWWSLAVE
jgi:hypothetical protein